MVRQAHHERFPTTYWTPSQRENGYAKTSEGGESRVGHTYTLYEEWREMSIQPGMSVYADRVLARAKYELAFRGTYTRLYHLPLSDKVESEDFASNLAARRSFS